MKREWILNLATAAGMSLLAAMPGFGNDKNLKQPTADANKPALKADKPLTKTDKVSAPSTKPATDALPI